MKRKRTRRDRLLETVLILSVIFPITTAIFYSLNLFLLAIVGLSLSWFFGIFSCAILIAVGIDRIWTIFFDKNQLPKPKQVLSARKQYILGDDGEIMEVVDDEKRKRGGESAAE